MFSSKYLSIWECFGGRAGIKGRLPRITNEVKRRSSKNKISGTSIGFRVACKFIVRHFFGRCWAGSEVASGHLGLVSKHTLFGHIHLPKEKNEPTFSSWEIPQKSRISDFSVKTKHCGSCRPTFVHGSISQEETACLDGKVHTTVPQLSTFTP